MSNTTVTEVSRLSEVTFRFALDDAEPRAVPHSRCEAHYRPTSLTVRVVNGSIQSPPVLLGPRLKKSGGDGAQVFQERLWANVAHPAYVTTAIERAERAVRKTNKEN